MPKSKRRRGGPSLPSSGKNFRQRTVEGVVQSRERRKASSDERTKAGTLNAYQCKKCRGHVVTVHKDPGTTPMFLGCRVAGYPTEDSCDGQMVSGMYRPFSPELGEPTWEWYSPPPSEYHRLPRMQQDHVDQGGLLLRPITESESTDASQP